MGIGIVEAYIISVVLALWVFGAILRKAGFPRWPSLLLLVPLVNIVVVWIFAFARWPAVDDER